MIVAQVVTWFINHWVIESSIHVPKDIRNAVVIQLDSKSIKACYHNTVMYATIQNENFTIAELLPVLYYLMIIYCIQENHNLEE
jgi:hypothetical protein